MMSHSRSAHRIFALLAIVILVLATLPVTAARAAGAHLDAPPGCSDGTLVCLPFLQITWGTPTSDPANGTFNMSIDRPGDGSFTLNISQLQVRVSYAAPTGTPPNAPPASPTAIDQYRTDGTTAIPQGGPTNETQVVFKAAASDPESEQYKLEVEVVPDSTAFSGSATCSSPLAASGSEASTGACGAFADGAYKWQYRLVDRAGASGDWTSFGASDPDFTVDVTPPAVSISSAPASVSGPSVQFDFTGTDAGGVAAFQCQLDGAGFSACTSPAAFDALSDGSHTFDVQAIDNAGNTGTPAGFTWTVDGTPPTVTITDSPTNPSNVTTPTFGFSGDDGAGSGIAGFQCRIDSGGFTPCTSGDSFGPLADGSHTFEVRAIDQVGNVSSPASGTWVVDATPPTAAITSSPANPSTAATATFEFTGDDGTGTGIAGFQCQIDSGGFAPCKSGDALGPLTDGSHTFEVEAIDNAANVGSPASFTWGIATLTPAAVSIQTAPSDPTNSTSASFTFSTTGSPTAVECALDSAAFAACESPTAHSYAGPLPEGSHTFTVRVTDAAGNTRTDSRTWVIDLTAPTLTITSSPSNPSNAASAVFAFSGDDGTGSGIAGFQCQVDSGAFAACSSGDSVGPLTDGVHTFAVQATDRAGNTSAPSTVTWTVDTTPPTVAIDGTPASFTGPSAQFAFTGSDAVGVASFQCKLDDADFAACTSPVSLASLSHGSHAFQVHAIDTAGNVGEPVSITWTVDSVGPTVSLTGQPPTLTADLTSTFSFTGDDGTGSGVASFQCKVDAGAFLPCTSPATFGPLADGVHTFSLIATDNVGNVGPTLTYSWTIVSATPTP